MKENIMSKEAFNELIDGLEYVESLTEYGRKNIKYHVQKLQQENKILKENAENNDKVVDKVNWENMLLKKKNMQLKERIEYLERSNDRREDTILEQRQKISDLEDNWNKLKEYINEANEDLYWTNNYDDILYVMQKIEGSDSNENNNI